MNWSSQQSIFICSVVIVTQNYYFCFELFCWETEHFIHSTFIYHLDWAATLGGQSFITVPLCHPCLTITWWCHLFLSTTWCHCFTATIWCHYVSLHNNSVFMLHCNTMMSLHLTEICNLHNTKQNHNMHHFHTVEINCILFEALSKILMSSGAMSSIMLHNRVMYASAVVGPQWLCNTLLKYEV